MSGLGSDVSGITSMPSLEEPADLCDDGEHSFRSDANGYRFCIDCNRSLQTLCDWYGHTTEGAL